MFGDEISLRNKVRFVKLGTSKHFFE